MLNNPALASELSYNVSSTIFAAAILGLLYWVGQLVLRRRLPNERDQRRAHSRLQYGLVGAFLILLTQIWVDGFTHLVTVLSLVSAALVVTNKELVMNMVGWLIINWRSLFTEHDSIEINGTKGRVVEIGILYFQIHLCSPLDGCRPSGRIIKIPNSWVIVHPIKNFSERSLLTEQVQAWTFQQESPVGVAGELILNTVQEILRAWYQNHGDYTSDIRRILSHASRGLENDGCELFYVTTATRPVGLRIQVAYYCYPRDAQRLKHKIEDQVWSRLQADNRLTLAEE